MRLQSSSPSESFVQFFVLFVTFEVKTPGFPPPIRSRASFRDFYGLRMRRSSATNGGRSYSIVSHSTSKSILS
jgi:hypothetical protein